jgi:hypothetical protein
MSKKKNQRPPPPPPPALPHPSIGGSADRWSRGTTLATIASVVVSILALAWLIFLRFDGAEHGSKTAAAAVSVKEALDSQAYPVVKFKRYQWIGPLDQSCERPANGVYLYLENASTVPVKVTWFQHDILIGHRSLIDVGKPVGSPYTNYILAPGNSVANGYKDKTFEAIYSNMTGSPMNPPVTFKVWARYSTLTSNRRCFKYQMTVDLDHDCRAANTQQHSYRDEKLEEIECQ